MKVSQVQAVNNTFKARHVAKLTSDLGHKMQTIDLYSLGSKSDIEFAKKMLLSIDLRKMYPEVSNYKGFEQWGNFIEYAVEKIGKTNVILAVNEKKPCGIMAYDSDGEGDLNLSYLAKWRKDPGEDVAYVGKALMQHLIKEAKVMKAEFVQLIAANITPRGKSCHDFYDELGFILSEPNGYMVLPDIAYDLKLGYLSKFFNNISSGECDKQVDAQKEFIIDEKKDDWISKVKNFFSA